MVRCPNDCRAVPVEDRPNYNLSDYVRSQTTFFACVLEPMLYVVSIFIMYKNCWRSRVMMFSIGFWYSRDLHVSTHSRVIAPYNQERVLNFSVVFHGSDIVDIFYDSHLFLRLSQLCFRQFKGVTAEGRSQALRVHTCAFSFPWNFNEMCFLFLGAKWRQHAYIPLS